MVTWPTESVDMSLSAHICSWMQLELDMAQKLRKPDNGGARTFPPEADGEFPIVPEKDIASWREALEERYRLGQGRLKVIEEPV